MLQKEGGNVKIKASTTGVKEGRELMSFCFLKNNLKGKFQSFGRGTRGVGA